MRPQEREARAAVGARARCASVRLSSGARGGLECSGCARGAPREAAAGGRAQRLSTRGASSLVRTRCGAWGQGRRSARRATRGGSLVPPPRGARRGETAGCAGGSGGASASAGRSGAAARRRALYCPPEPLCERAACAPPHVYATVHSISRNPHRERHQTRAPAAHAWVTRVLHRETVAARSTCVRSPGLVPP